MTALLTTQIGSVQVVLTASSTDHRVGSSYEDRHLLLTLENFSGTLQVVEATEGAAAGAATLATNNINNSFQQEPPVLSDPPHINKKRRRRVRNAFPPTDHANATGMSILRSDVEDDAADGRQEFRRAESYLRDSDQLRNNGEEESDEEWDGQEDDDEDVVAHQSNYHKESASILSPLGSSSRGGDSNEGRTDVVSPLTTNSSPTKHSVHFGPNVSFVFSNALEGDDNCAPVDINQASATAFEEAPIPSHLDDNNNNNNNHCPTSNDPPTPDRRRRTGIVKQGLHTKCRQPGVTFEELRAALLEEPQAAKVTDVTGRLPLHILGENESLLSTRKGRDDATAFCLQLMDAYPDAIHTEDEFERYPFESMIFEWVFCIYKRFGAQYLDIHDEEEQQTIMDLFHFGERERLGLMDARFHTILSQFSVTGANNSDDATNNEGHENHVPQTSLSSEFPDVVVGPILEWSFTMISTAFDRCCGRFASRNMGGYRKMARTVGSKLAHHFAGMPLLFRAVLMIEDDETRVRILGLSIMRRALLCSGAVDRWLTGMLRQQGLAAKRAVDYLEMVSKANVRDVIGKYRTPRSEDYLLLKEEQDTMFETFDNLDGIISSLIVLPDHEIERAAATDMMWRVLSAAGSRPFSVSMVLMDFVWHVTLLLVTRVTLFWTPDINERSVENTTLPPSPTPVITVDTPISYFVTYVICLQFLLRKLAEITLLARTSRNVLSHYLFDFWNMLELTSTAVVFAMVAVFEFPYIYRHLELQILTIALLWLKFLAFLRGVNVELATFILSVLHIGYSVRWFLMVLVLVILMFGDIMHLLALKLDSGTFCGDNDVAVSDFCSSFVRSYLRMWTILLGDFNFHTFQEAPGFEVFWFLFTLLGVIVLLNVLIAVVSDSYERSRISAKKLFGRARVDFAVAHNALEQALSLDTKAMNKFVCIRIGRRPIPILRLFMLGMCFFNSVLSLVYLLRMSSKHMPQWGSAWPLACFTCAFILSVAIIVFVNATCGALLKPIFRVPVIGGLCRFFERMCEWTVRLVSQQLLGLSASPQTSESSGDEWIGKIDHLSRVMEALVTASERNVMDEVKAAEGHITFQGRRLTEELKEEIGKLE